MAIKIREAARDPESLKVFQPFAEAIVRAKHLPNDREVNHQRAAQLFLDFVRANVRYRPDPPLVEFVKGAGITLCVPGAEVCIPVGDCDDLVTALASLCMAYGIETKVIAQDFGPKEDLHVLCAIRNEDGEWLAADPSHPNMPVGRRLPAVRELWYDPLKPEELGLEASDGDFVSIGSLPRDHLHPVRFVGADASADDNTGNVDAPTTGLSTGAKWLIGAAAILAVGGGIFVAARTHDHKRKHGLFAGEAYEANRRVKRMAASL